MPETDRPLPIKQGPDDSGKAAIPLDPGFDQSQRLLDVLHTGKRYAQRLGDLGTGLPGLNQLLHACTCLVGDHGAFAALLLVTGLCGPARMALSVRVG